MGVKQPKKTSGFKPEKSDNYLEVQPEKIGDLYETLGLKQQFGIQPAEKVTKLIDNRQVI